MTTIREIKQNDSIQWDNFVLSQHESDYSHLYGWKNIYEDAYSLNTFYLGAFEEENLIAVLPTVVIKFPLKKRVAFSLPYLNYSGLLKSRIQDENFLLGKIFEYLQGKNIGSLELRNLDSTSVIDEGICTLKLALPENAEVLWNGFKPKIRNQIRKAQKYGFDVKWGTDHLDSFYKIYSKNMRDLGTPVHSKKFFSKIIEIFPSQANILTIYKGKIAVASMLLMKHKNSIGDPWASSLKEYLEFCPNMLLYWEVLKFSCQNGFNQFDFGRSQYHSGTYNFKTQWGCKPINLDYRVVSFDSKIGGTSASFYKSEKVKYFSFIWKVLPQIITNWFGPLLRKYLP